ncbi:MAG: tetratricopeptide repeat protein, partial [Candidatus Eremiobacteraeota bacterium]|nr:tetratricopeptide repeat protein [Candidatus Eremiobacteraeota bacterium]
MSEEVRESSPLTKADIKPVEGDKAVDTSREEQDENLVESLPVAEKEEAEKSEPEAEEAGPEEKPGAKKGGLFDLFRSRTTPEQDCLHAYAELLMKRYFRTIKFARRALDVSPNYPEAQRILVMAYQGEGRLAEAELTARAAIIAAPDNPDGYYLMGSILAGIGELEESEKNFQKAIELDPGNIDFQLDYAAFLLHQRRFKKVLDMANKILEIDPKNEKAELLKTCAKEEEWREGVDDSLYQPPMPA